MDQVRQSKDNTMMTSTDLSNKDRFYYNFTAGVLELFKNSHLLQWSPNSPNVPVHGGGAHDTFSDRDNALHRLGLDGEAIAGGSKAVPVEDVDGPLAGAANYLPAPLH